MNSVAIWLGQDNFKGIVTFGGLYKSLLKKQKIKEFPAVYLTQITSEII